MLKATIGQFDLVLRTYCVGQNIGRLHTTESAHGPLIICRPPLSTSPSEDLIATGLEKISFGD